MKVTFKVSQITWEDFTELAKDQLGITGLTPDSFLTKEQANDLAFKVPNGPMFATNGPIKAGELYFRMTSQPP
ncbi:MAG TPA: hypothetical protein VEA59_01030 [Patescibacteria group bacterium]|nr:hypothetical protein [Patescibacteria group bacterium]